MVLVASKGEIWHSRADLQSTDHSPC